MLTAKITKIGILSMAIFLLGSFVTDIRKSCGGTTFIKNAYGNVMQNKPSQLSKRSERQLDHRPVYSFLASYWKNTLSEASKTEWINLAKTIDFKNSLGQVFHISGFNLFMKYQMLYYYGGFSIPKAIQSLPGIAMPPVTTDDTTPYFTHIGNVLHIESTSFLGFSPGASTNRVLFFMSPGKPDSISLNTRIMRFSDYCQGQAGLWSPQNIYPPFRYIADYFFTIKMYHIDSYGRVSSPVIIQRQAD